MKMSLNNIYTNTLFAAMCGGWVYCANNYMNITTEFQDLTLVKKRTVLATGTVLLAGTYCYLFSFNPLLLKFTIPYRNNAICE